MVIDNYQLYTNNWLQNLLIYRHDTFEWLKNHYNPKCCDGNSRWTRKFDAFFTEKLKEYYQRNTSLKLKPNDADLLLESTIVGYELTPVSATSGDKAALNRLTIRVEVRFVNSKKEEENFEKEFSFYQDFPQEQTLAQVEGSLVPKIIDQLVLNIFTDTAAQW